MTDGGVNLGSAFGSITISTDGVSKAVADAQRVFDQGLAGMGQSLERFGQQVSNVGSAISKLTAPLAIGLGVATKSALDFDDTMHNIGAILGLNEQQIKALGDRLNTFGKSARAGPQEVAAAFYDVVGGTNDATIRMDILEQSVKAAEAGHADLRGTVKAMISTMNAYGFSAKEAAFASDVLTQTVNKGVGTMDNFASAFPLVTGLAHELGVGFDDLGSDAAYLTTKGVTASEAMTELSGMMVALIRPNDAMEKALKDLGYQSGQAAIKALGLRGAYEALKKGKYGSDMAGMTGRVEAMRGAISLTGDGVQQFADDFKKGIKGATDAAQKIQLKSGAAQIDLLRSSLSALANTIGEKVIPYIIQAVQAIRPLIDKVMAWVNANPQLTTQLLMIGAALVGLGPVLFIAGQMISAIGTIIMGVGAAVGFLLSPLGLVVAAIGLLAAAFVTNFLGIRDFLQPIIERIGKAWELFRKQLDQFIANIRKYGFVKALASALNIGSGKNAGWIEGVLTALGLTKDVADKVIKAAEMALLPIAGVFDRVLGAAQLFGAQLGQFITNVLNVGLIPSLMSALDAQMEGSNLGPGWIQGVLMKLFGLGQNSAGTIISAISQALKPILDAVILTINGFFATFQDISAGQNLFDALTNGIGQFVDNILRALGVSEGVAKSVQGLFFTVVSVVQTAWDAISGTLAAFGAWFMKDGLPAIVAFVEGTVLPAIQRFFDFLGQAWGIVQPKLQALYDWFVTTGLPAVENFITGTVIPGIQDFINILIDIWDAVAPKLLALLDWFVNTGMPAIVAFINTSVMPVIDGLIKVFQDIWNAVEPALASLFDWFKNSGLPLINNALNFFKLYFLDPAIKALQDIWSVAQPALTKLHEWFIAHMPEIQNAIQAVTNTVTNLLNQVNMALSLLNQLKTGQVGGHWEASGPGGVGQRWIPDRDSGGPGMANMPYLITPKVGSELFVPQTNGTFLPHFDQIMANLMGDNGNGSNNSNITFAPGSVTVNANSYAEGQRAADGFQTRLTELLRRRG